MPETGGEAGKEGVVEDLKGRAKDVAGTVLGDERMEAEGEAQRERAAAEREVAAKEAQAEKARAEASSLEAEQRANE